MFNTLKYREIQQILKKNNENCQIVAVSKNHPKESVVEAINNGVLHFGENRVLEAKEKFSDLKVEYPKIKLHLTGPLQSNKVKIAVSLFDIFHTLDREKIAIEFSKYNDKLFDKKIFIQVNTGKEKNKSGIFPNEFPAFKDFCVNDIGLNIVGLMCIPPIDDDPKVHFKILQELSINSNLKHLSIGMSSDYNIALKYNPTYIRIGTLLFGNRI
tara:strand:- start:886 stop:1524 length:639 start_codon:yes stop_codon:yes gene_type:complete